MTAAGSSKLEAAVACALAVAAICPAVAAQGAIDVVALIDGKEIPGSKKAVRLVKYGGQLYELIEPGGLKSLALVGKRVCVHGKLGEWAAQNTFRLIGSDRRFKVANRAMVARIMQGANVWLAGKAKRLQDEASCYMEVHLVVRLPRDRELFDLRFASYVHDGKWQRLLDLANWIEVSGRQAGSARLEDVRPYRVLRGKAIREALRIRERELEERAPDDAEGWYGLARMYFDLLGRAGRHQAGKRLHRAVTADPRHKRAQELLKELGFVFYDQRWISRDEYEDIQREKDRLLAVASEKGDGKDAPDETGTGAVSAREAREALPLRDRTLRILEIERQVRSGPQGLALVADRLDQEDDKVARRVVWILANTGDIAGAGWQALLKRRRSLAAAVRRDVADALAWREQVPELDEMIREERDPEVRLHGVDALAAVSAPKSVGALVSLASLGDERTRSRVNAALQRLTGESITGAEGWDRWWKDNKDTFRPPAGTP